MLRIKELFHLLTNGIYEDHNPLTNLLLTSWDIQVTYPTHGKGNSSSQLPWNGAHVSSQEGTLVAVGCPFINRSINIDIKYRNIDQTLMSYYTLQGINISHLGKRKIIFKMPFWGDMLVPWRVSILFNLLSFSTSIEIKTHLSLFMNSFAKYVVSCR